MFRSIAQLRGLLSILCIYGTGPLHCGNRALEASDMCQTWSHLHFTCLDPTFPIEQYSRRELAILIEAAEMYPTEMVEVRQMQGEADLGKLLRE